MIIFTRKSRTAWSEQLYQTIKPTGKRRTGNGAGDDPQWEAFKGRRPWRFTMSLHHLRFALVFRLYFSQHHHVILKELKLLKSQVDSEIWKEKKRWNCLHSAELPSGSNRQQMDEFGGRDRSEPRRDSQEGCVQRAELFTWERSILPALCSQLPTVGSSEHGAWVTPSLVLPQHLAHTFIAPLQMLADHSLPPVPDSWGSPVPALCLKPSRSSVMFILPMKVAINSSREGGGLGKVPRRF